MQAVIWVLLLFTVTVIALAQCEREHKLEESRKILDLERRKYCYSTDNPWRSGRGYR
jgi:hypothetical protein